MNIFKGLWQGAKRIVKDIIDKIRGKKPKTPAPPIPPEPPKVTPTPEKPEEPIDIILVDPEEIEAAAEIQQIRDLLIEGAMWTTPAGHTQGGGILENENAEHISSIIESGIEKHGLVEAWKRLKEWSKGANILELIKRIMLGHYEPEFSAWGGMGGRTAWDKIISELCEVLEVTDTYAGIFS